MASRPITSWQTEVEKVETVVDFIFLDSKITADCDCSHEVKRHLLLGRKALTNLDSILKHRHITWPTKVCQINTLIMDFSASRTVLLWATWSTIFYYTISNRLRQVQHYIFFLTWRNFGVRAMKSQHGNSRVYFNSSTPGPKYLLAHGKKTSNWCMLLP